MSKNTHEVTNQSGEVVMPFNGTRLNFYAIYTVLKKNHGKHLTAKKILQQLQNDYAITISESTIKRMLGGVCYDLLQLTNSSKNIFPFYVHCFIPFDKKTELCFSGAIQSVIGRNSEEISTNNNSKENISLEDIKKQNEILEEINLYFPITENKEKKFLNLHFPIKEQEEMYEKYLIAFMEIFRDKNPNTNEPKNSFYFDTNVEFSIEEEAFTDVEQKMLMDAIEAYAYISKKDTAEFMEKLDRISTGIPLNKYKDLGENAYPGKVESVAGNDGETFFDNLSAVIKAISNNHKVEIIYGEYDVVGTKPKLNVRSNYKTTQQNEMIRCAKKNQKCNKNNCDKAFSTSPKIISPYNTMWANGYYYLIASFEKHPANISALRMDRILDVNEIEEQRAPVPEKYKYALVGRAENQEFSAQQIANKAVVMHTEVPQRIEFECKKYMLNNVVDGFGFEISLQEFRRDEQDWIKVHANASLGGAALWLTQHCADSVAIFPPELVDKVITNLNKGTQHYHDREK